MSNATIGAIVGASFGCAWGIVGSLGLPHRFRDPSIIFVAAISLALIIALVVHPSRLVSRKFRGGIYAGSIALEVMVIFAGSAFLQPPRLQPFILPFIGFVVGLHFIGLWKATDLPLFLWIAAAMCLVCVVAAFLPTGSGAGVNARILVTGMGSAFVLWAAGLFTLLH